MPFFTASLGSVSSGIAFLSHFFDNTCHNTALITNPAPSLSFPCSLSRSYSSKRATFLKVSVSSGSSTRTDDGLDQDVLPDHIIQDRGSALVFRSRALATYCSDSIVRSQNGLFLIDRFGVLTLAPKNVEKLYCAFHGERSADWKAARAYNEKGLIYEGRIEGFNGGGLLIKFYSLIGFLPFPQLSPVHSCKEPHKSIQDIARALTGSMISVKVIQADEENKKLIFSEKETAWSRYSSQLKVGDLYEGIVGSVEDYGAFVHLRFPDGQYHLTGLVHVSEVSWDLVHDVRDVLTEGDKVNVKIVNIDREKSRITLSIKQLEEDPLLETLDKVIPQDASVDSDTLSANDHLTIEPLPGLDTIIGELLKEDGIDDVRISRQGFEKRVVSQDLQLWLSNAPPIGDQYTLLARAGRQVQEIQLTTSLNQKGIKKALQHVLERVP